MYFKSIYFQKSQLRAGIREMHLPLFSACGITVAFHDDLVLLVKLIKKQNI